MKIIRKSKNQQIVKLFKFLLNKNLFFLKLVLYSATLWFGQKSKQIQFNLPKNCEQSEFIKRLPYIINKGPYSNNKVLGLLRNRKIF